MTSERLSAADAVDLAARAFQRAGVPLEAARDAAEILALAEMMGIATHGLTRVETYALRIEAGGTMPMPGRVSPPRPLPCASSTGPTG